MGNMKMIAMMDEIFAEKLAELGGSAPTVEAQVETQEMTDQEMDENVELVISPDSDDDSVYYDSTPEGELLHLSEVVDPNGPNPSSEESDLSAARRVTSRRLNPGTTPMR